MSVVTEKKPKGLILALGMSEPPDGLEYSPELDRERLVREKERLEKSLEGYSPAWGQSQTDFEKHILGKDDHARLEELRKQLGELDKPKKKTPKEPEPKAKKSEDTKARGRWRKANSEFHPYKLLGERLKEKEEGAGNGAKIMGLFDDAMKKADEFEYDEAIGFLKDATKLAKESQKEVDEERKRIAEETKKDEERQKKAFDFVVIVKDKEYGFDSDTDAENFYLANTIGEGSVGTLKKSDKLKEMEELLGKCGERKRALQAKGATIDEIVNTVYKNVPKSLWPDDVIKEVALYNAVKKQIESEKELEDAEDQLKDLAEKSETAGDVLETLKSATEAAKEKFGEKSEKFGESMEIVGKMASSFSLANSLLGAGASGLSAGEKHQELEEIEDNPVKEKIVEFERNKAIVECVNGLVDGGLGEISDWVPVLNVVTKSKESLMEAAKAGYYFKNTLNLKVLEKGAKTDPRSAGLLPLARLAREQKIALSESAFKAVASALEATSKGLELAVVAAPVGLALDVTSKVLNYGSKAIITGINWSDASKAAKLIKQAAGPPALRRAQIEVMKYSSKYAKVAVVHLAMKERDPWAIGHLENVGLGREDIDHPKTTSKLIREYMALKAGGILGDEQGEDQETIGESFIGKVGEKIADAAEWVRDKVVGRNTKIEYDPSWRAESHDLSVEDWKAASKGAIAAGWYDSRPGIEGDLGSYAEAASAYNHANASNIEATIAAASDVMAVLGSLREEFQKIKPVTNDKKTEHAGMKAFLFDWWKLAGQRLDVVSETRSRYLDEQSFPGLKGEALEQAKKKMLDDAIEKAKEDQTKKMATRKQAIADLWDDYEIKTPYAKCKLLDFPKEVKGGLLKFGAAGSLDFGDPEVSELAVEVKELRKSVLERLNSELMASPDKDLTKNFKASAMTAEKYIVEALRATCERLFEAKQRKEGKSSPPLWTPKPADIVLDWETWRKVIDAAKDGGWDQEENTGFTESLKAYQEALEAYEAETKKTEPNVTIVEQQRGIILGSIDEFEGKLRKFKPVTKQKFFHPGLIAYRDGMIELCVAARIKYDSGT